MIDLCSIIEILWTLVYLSCVEKYLGDAGYLPESISPNVTHTTFIYLSMPTSELSENSNNNVRDIMKLHGLAKYLGSRALTLCLRSTMEKDSDIT
jgi:hypothetical protein